MTNINVIQARPFQLAEPIGTSDTEITVKNLFDIYGDPIVMSGDIQYSTVEPQSQTNQEIISYTGIVQLTTTTSKLTGVTRGLDAQPDPITGLYGSSPSQAKAHSANAECILSDNPQVWDKKTSKDEEETISKEWTFEKSPIVPTPTQDDQAATKEYADTLAILGSPDASTTAKGIARLTASPNVTLGSTTVTIATPAVFTKATHGLTVNDTVQFTTTGALPTGLLPSVTYYVIATGLTANDFQVSATYGGSAVATSGSQSGTHTAVRTTPRVVGENDTRLPTQDENNGLVGTSGTPVSASNPLVDDDDPRLVATVTTKIEDTTYPAGETLSAGNVVFIENAPTTAQATVYNQNIGDAASRTRVSFPIFGSGVLNQEMFKLNLMKIGSPSVSLGIRFETDDGSGNPSGTLLNATSSATVVAGDVTGAFVDTTILAAGFLAIPAGKKCHCVVFQGTYGSETVNGSNYYRIGATNAIHTTTRGAKYWSGTAWGAMQNTVFPYIGSNPAQNPFSDYVLSKTDADFTYKIDWHGITQEAVTAGDLATGKFPKIAISGVDSNQTGMTQGTTMYLGNTPGAISSSAGTNSVIIGEAISDTKMQIKEDNVILSTSTIASFLTNSSVNTGTTYTKKAQFVIKRAGAYTITGTSKGDTSGSSYTVYCAIYKNGVLQAQNSASGSSSPEATVSAGIYFSAGDLAEFYVKTSNAGYGAYMISGYVSAVIFPSNGIPLGSVL